MRQIHRATQQTGHGPGTLLAGVAAFSSPVYGALGRSYGESWTALAWRQALSALDHAVDSILTWRERARTRRQLLAMDDRLLSDIGITRAEAHHEAEKPFWRV
ncbi:MAG: DUF1127 domain-containing protein [Geminicoccales bacterium]